MSNGKRKITMERSYRAPLEDVWELWTTKQGIESWWGPEGFAVTVRSIDLRPGGALLYTMTALAPEMVAFMNNANMPVSTDHRLSYTEVVPRRRLAYTNLTDFIPGVEPYETSTTVELEASGDSVRMLLTFDAMHDETWTQRAVMGHESELGKLDKLLASPARDG
jgi:uncharacterized protein YndB with AHSA1/START domain